MTGILGTVVSFRFSFIILKLSFHIIFGAKVIKIMHIGKYFGYKSPRNVKKRRKFGKIRVSLFPIVPLHRITLFGPFILNGGSIRRTSKENVFINLRENIQ